MLPPSETMLAVNLRRRMRNEYVRSLSSVLQALGIALVVSGIIEPTIGGRAIGADGGLWWFAAALVLLTSSVLVIGFLVIED